MSELVALVVGDPVVCGVLVGVAVNRTKVGEELFVEVGEMVFAGANVGC